MCRFQIYLAVGLALATCTDSPTRAADGDADSVGNRFERYASRAGVSPDGTKLVFVHSPERGTIPAELYLAAVDGADARPLTSPGVRAKKAPTWSPDGQRIAYQGVTDRGVQIFMVDSSGSDPRQLTHADGDSLEPAWTPDGSTILFYSNREAEKYQLFAMNRDGTEQRRLLTSESNDSFPRVSKRGKIVFVSDRGQTEGQELFLVDRDGTGLRQLTTMPGSVWCPAWSPDGTRVVFSHNRDSPKIGSPGNYDLYVIDESGANLRALTTEPGQELFPTWTADGEAILFGSDMGGGWTIHRVNLATGRIAPVDLRE